MFVMILAASRRRRTSWCNRGGVSARDRPVPSGWETNVSVGQRRDWLKKSRGHFSMGADTDSLYICIYLLFF